MDEREGEELKVAKEEAKRGVRGVGGGKSNENENGTTMVKEMMSLRIKETRTTADSRPNEASTLLVPPLAHRCPELGPKAIGDCHPGPIDGAALGKARRRAAVGSVGLVERLKPGFDGLRLADGHHVRPRRTKGLWEDLHSSFEAVEVEEEAGDVIPRTGPSIYSSTIMERNNDQPIIQYADQTQRKQQTNVPSNGSKRQDVVEESMYLEGNQPSLILQEQQEA
ncbi:hypothetical protein MUK42_33230 [Musa troglodytarum]|uniref:Uncharacterized protein n=1 Tax=Musa troglodytarum TaxID=320322 RepID=A0A9E7GJU2_9LILI|nr:hypothetical protein MUK42_33230 [Musa troglodytarum]